MGRKLLLTKEITKEIISYIEQGNTNQDAYTMAGISRAAFYSWLSIGEKDKKNGKETKYSNFFEMVKGAACRFKAANIAIIQKAAISGKQWQAAAWLLERKFPEEFGKRDYVNIEGGMDINNFDIELTEKDRKEYEKRLKEFWEDK